MCAQIALDTAAAIVEKLTGAAASATRSAQLSAAKPEETP